MLEYDAFLGETIEVGRERTLGAEKAHAVGASGVEGDQDQVRFGGGCGERKTKKQQTHARTDSSYHGNQCKGCSAIDQNQYGSKPGVQSSPLPLRYTVL